ncbi:SDR family NAD(P)-dependent oxidoreductase [Roseisalinus antarcticus]|uniref:3-oxoacyl-[acyl-carrier-protein] reductase FabG n=1 Tax=Roseisalinus antarcticus TaxID=254357 RepID=A0A1Y5TEB2_9RHOB|nr:3-oxoacyl-ACP reductase family protein [Roseisalinus antarcticus]SLN61933.1 3-oxoacyl-[acyl-carrier-protein] reductase FabG [Roseisalinus antarcticus]
MTQKLKGRTALVTGGSRGIGAAIAVSFAEECADVVFCHHDDPEGARLVESRIAALDRRVASVQGDVADPVALTRLWEAAAAFGPVDILVNNAGTGGDQPFDEISVADFDKMIAVNLRAQFLLSQLALAGMRRRRWGRIINIASQLAYKGAPGLTHYSASKAGVVGFTRALAAEVVKDGILVNAIAPGPVETALTDALSPEWQAWKMAQLPIGRFGQPAEIAPTAVLLASSGGDYYVGQTLSPNGGDVFL